MNDFIINHDPDGGDNLIERNKRYENTLILMEKYFHEKLDSNVWEPAQSVSAKRPRDDISDDKTTDEELDEIITIRFRDLAGDEMFFKIRKSTKLEKAISAYAQRRRLSLDALKFLHHGRRIGSVCTPRSLGMEVDDQVDVMLVEAGC
jgi:small ubiquitin-related modifier